LINVLSLLIIVAVAVPLGVLSAVHQDSLFDRITAVFVFIGFAVPTFWLALLLMIFFGIDLGWLPISGLRSLNYEYLARENVLLILSSILFYRFLFLPLADWQDFRVT